MADLRLNVTGDGSEGAEAMREVARAAGELDGATKKLGDSTKKAGESAKLSIADWKALGDQVMGSLGGIIDFTKESIAEFAEQERAERQLELATGDLADAFKVIAGEMQSTLGVSDDMVVRMITLADRYGTMPTQIEPATRAILDWAAATGGDAESGMQTLLRSIEFGQEKIKGLGIEFKSTGDKTKDLEAAVAALTVKFGGSADAMADTLSGRTSKLTGAFSDLKEALGGAFDTVDRGIGFTDALAAGFKNLSANISDFVQIAKNAADFGWGDWLAHGTGGAAAPFKALASGTKQFDTDGGDADPVDGVRGAGAITKTTFGNNKSDKAGAKAADKIAARLAKEKEAGQFIHDFYAAEDAADAARELRNESAKLAAHERQFEEERRQNERLIAEAERADRKEAERVTKGQEKWEQREADKNEKQLKLYEKNQKKIEDQAARFEATMQQAAANAAVAFIGTISDALTSAFAGEEVDGVEMGLDILGTVLGVAGMAVGTYFGGAAGGQIGGALGGAVGGVAKGIYRAEKKGKKHDGGWIDSYHSGGWPGLSSDEEMAILQRDERVLSRSEVQRMGGKSGVDAAARGRGGGGGNVFHVNSLDALSFSGFMSAQGGAGFRNTLVTGHGPLPALFGRF